MSKSPQILEKGLVSYNYTHRILAEFLSLTGPSGAADIAQARTRGERERVHETGLSLSSPQNSRRPDYPCSPTPATHQSVTGPALLRMIHTLDGVRAASALLGASTAKERKALLKAVKARCAGHTHFAAPAPAPFGLALWSAMACATPCHERGDSTICTVPRACTS